MTTEKDMRRPAQWTDPGTVPAHLKDKFARRVKSAESSLAPPPWMRKIHALSIVMSLGAGFYTMMYTDYGPHEHIFSPIRRWYFGKVQQWTSLSDADLAELKSRNKL
ncbi:hypothetical protein H9P43_008465 [Blastocladiella emersonii ATCC 22665]|nr:hypothetical protein H9P43_008465 [Blastocladiella emersonii ATCC 22665]